MEKEAREILLQKNLRKMEVRYVKWSKIFRFKYLKAFTGLVQSSTIEPKRLACFSKLGVNQKYIHQFQTRGSIYKIEPTL